MTGKEAEKCLPPVEHDRLLPSLETSTFVKSKQVGRACRLVFSVDHHSIGLTHQSVLKLCSPAHIVGEVVLPANRASLCMRPREIE
jgi:hypothetical protein